MTVLWLFITRSCLYVLLLGIPGVEGKAPTRTDGKGTVSGSGRITGPGQNPNGKSLQIHCTFVLWNCKKDETVQAKTIECPTTGNFILTSSWKLHFWVTTETNEKLADEKCVSGTQE